MEKTTALSIATVGLRSGLSVMTSGWRAIVVAVSMDKPPFCLFDYEPAPRSVKRYGLDILQPSDADFDAVSGTAGEDQ
jgi:hypothetical protein